MRKNLFILTVLCFMTVGSAFATEGPWSDNSVEKRCQATARRRSPIVDFVSERDIKTMLKLFYDDRHWLVVGPDDYDPDFLYMLKYRSPGKWFHPRYIG